MNQDIFHLSFAISHLSLGHKFKREDTKAESRKEKQFSYVGSFDEHDGLSGINVLFFTFAPLRLCAYVQHPMTQPIANNDK